jgi:capsular polysaccharide biosynthesis protein
VYFNPLSRCYSWLSLSGTDNYNKGRFLIAPVEWIQIPMPLFVGFGAKKAAKRTPARELPSPKIEIFEFSKVVVVGGVDFLFLDDRAIHHDLFVPGEHRCPAENAGVVSSSKAGSSINLRLTKAVLDIDNGASLIGQCSGNYAHWLTETLPKLATLDVLPHFADLPLLVDIGLHQNIMDSIDLINSNKRPVIAIPRWAPMRVNRLATVSAPGYERYVSHSVAHREPSPYINIFSRPALSLLRDSVTAALGDSAMNEPKRIYLSRSVASSSNLRQIVNANEIECLLDHAGIHIFRPDSMTFKEQVRVCVNAELIVGGIGASLANMIFAPPGCKIVCLSPYYDEANWFYYTNLAGVLGHQIHFVLGLQTSTQRHPRHRDYVINLNSLMSLLH